MKKKVLMLSYLFISTVFAQNIVVAKGITFVEGSWADAVMAAKKANKTLFVDCYADWCGYCKEMAKEVFPDDKVGEFYNANFISYKINIEEEEGKAIFAKYGANGNGLPAFIFVNPKDESMICRKSGATDADFFIEIGQMALDIPVQKSLYLSGKMNQDDKITFWYMLQGTDLSLYTDVLAYLAAQKPEDMLLDTNFYLMMDYATNPESREFQYFITHTVEYKGKYKEDALKYFENVAGNVYKIGVKKRDKKFVLDFLDHYVKFKEMMPADFNLETYKADIKSSLDDEIK